MLKIIGFARLTRDPEITEIGETCVAKFGVAVNEVYYKNNEKVEVVNFFDCELWDTGARNFVKYNKRGDLVMLEGRLRTDKWTDKESGKNRSKVFIRVDKFQMLGKAAKTAQIVDGAEPVAEPVAAAAGTKDAPF